MGANAGKLNVGVQWSPLEPRSQAGAVGVAAILGAGFMAGVMFANRFRLLKPSSSSGEDEQQQQQQQQQAVNDETPLLPPWFRAIQSDRSGRYKEVRVREWDSPAWRSSHGWQGSDLIHSRSSKGARIVGNYYWDTAERSLVGCVHFGPACEGNYGVCHGGSMTSVMDDLLGWTCFVAGDGPWSGCTAQVNVKLCKPVAVGQYLRIVGTPKDELEGAPPAAAGVGALAKKKKRKVAIRGVLDDPSLLTDIGGAAGAAAGAAEATAAAAAAGAATGAAGVAGAGAGAVVYAELDGVAVHGVKIAGEGNEAVSSRVWVDTETARTDSMYYE